MKHGKLLSFYVCLVMLFCPLCVHGQYFKHLGMEHGLSNPSVLSIYQDTLGRMWFGTNEGINLYDGKQMRTFKSYDVPGGKKYINRSVHQIEGDRHGNIFFLNGSILLRYSLFADKLEEIADYRIDAITIKGDSLFCAYDSNLYVYDSKTNGLNFYKKMKVKEVCCLTTLNNDLCIGTKKGLYLLQNDSLRCVLPNNEIFKLFVNRRKELWIATRFNGLYRRMTDGTVRQVGQGHGELASYQVREMEEDHLGNIWFGTFNGLQVYNPYTDTFKLYQATGRDGSLSHSSVFSLLMDRQGTLWIGTYYGGVNYFNAANDIFSYYSYGSDSRTDLSFPLVGPMIEDKDHDVWICTDGGGLNRLHRINGTFDHYRAGGSNSLLHGNLKSIAYDRGHDHIYVGTYTGGLSRLDRKTGQIYNYLPHDEQLGNTIFHLQIVDHWLYASSRTGFWRMDLNTQEWALLYKLKHCINFFVDSKNMAWLATSSELHRMNVDSRSPRLVPVTFDSQTGEQPRVSNVIETQDGSIVITTMGHGVYVYYPTLNEWKQLTQQTDGLISDFCYNSVETPDGNILVSCENGLSIYSKITQMIRSIDLGFNGSISAVMEGCGLLASSDGQVYVGGVDGMISFREEDLNKKNGLSRSTLYFTDIAVNNSQIKPNDEFGILTQILPFTKELRLKHHQNNLSISFVNVNYVESWERMCHYYMLEGFDPFWQSVEDSRLNYTNLPPGRYTLRVKCEHLGKDCGSISLPIYIASPWYNTWWAYLLYVILAVGILFVIYSFLSKRRTLALSLAQEREEKRRMEELNKIKLRFFTNISHEFRTPLTLIIGQIELLLQESELSGLMGRKLQGIYRNAMSLRILITELLDFRKQEQGFMKLKVSCVNAVSFVSDIFTAFAELAAHKQIAYSFESSEEKLELWCDTTQLQKVLYNIISNAFKYTKEGGRIKVSVGRKKGNIEISVSDTGCGIKEEDLDKIFERFYRVDEGTTKAIAGSGIGLAFSKSMVEAHHGQIQVKSAWGEGSCFVIQLRSGSGHFAEDELTSVDGQCVVSSSDWQEMLAVDAGLLQQPEELSKEGKEPEEAIEKPSVLLVEDNDEMMCLLENIFKADYCVIKAFNGQEGFEKAVEYRPNLVISDVMMPVMSGKELCYKIKNSLELAYIPVMLLTAQTTEEHVVEGYQFGADMYMTKPFNVRVLKACCANLLANRRMLMKKTLGQFLDNSNLPKGLNAVDQKLLDEATRIIRTNFDNPQFDMSMLATELNMGRSKMFARIKEITGFTPNEFVMKLKLEEAQHLIEKSIDCNIADISYSLGFSSPRYFSRCFKDFYGISPLNFRKKLEGKL